MSKNVNILKSSKHVTPENMELVSLKDYRGLETEFNKALARIDFLDHTIDAMNNEIAELCPKGQSLIESIADKEKQLAEARAEIERKNEELDMFLAEQQAMGEIIESKDKQLAEARAEIERLSSRDGNAKHELVYDDGENPFAREKLEHIDFGVCDNQYVLESHLLNNTLEKVKAKDKLIEQMRGIINDYRIEHKAWCNHDPDNAKECTCGLSEKVKATLEAEKEGG